MSFDNKVLSFQQGCEYLGYKRASVYNMISKGILPYSKPRRKIYFDKEALEKWMLNNSNEVQNKSINQQEVSNG